MKRTTQRESMLVGALLGAMVTGQAMAADLRYQGSGDYFDTMAATGVNGWQAGGSGPNGLPGVSDTARCNWANNTVTLDREAPLVGRFQLGVDQSGQLVVNAGGKLVTTGTTGNSTVGNNANAGIVGRLTVNTGGEVVVTNVLFVGASATGILTIDGGTVRVTSHLWGGSAAAGVGTIILTNGGSLTVGGNIGLGTINASTASGGKCSAYVQDGGTLNLNQISAVNSIQPGSVLDLSGTGVVKINGNVTNVINAYITAAKITSHGGAGTVGVDHDILNPGKTTIYAIAPVAPPPTEVVWNPAANPSTTGHWNEKTNWTGFVAPVTVTKVIFNVAGAIPCTVSNSASADYVVMGDNGPGGTLILTNGGLLTCGAVNATVIGYNNSALMVVESGATASFGHQLWVGLDSGSDGTLILNGGTVSVANMFGLGYQGGKGTVQVRAGTLQLAQWDNSSSIQGESRLDVSGTGVVVINGDHVDSINMYIAMNQVTANGGTGTVVVDYNIINVGKTTIYPQGLPLAPAQAVWNPVLNFPDVEGLWNVSANWSVGMTPGDVTVVNFNVVDAIPCTVTNAAAARQVVMGANGPGGTLIVTNGASLAVGSIEWSGIGYNNTALMVVERNASASFGNHLWVGFEGAADGTLIVNGGTVSVAGMFGLGWNGGKGTAQINGGTLNLSQLHPTDSIKGASVLNLTGTATVLITGNQLTPVANYVNSGKITAEGGRNVAYSYDSVANKTTLQVAPAQQGLTGVAVNGGNVSISFNTVAGHIYHVESTPEVSPAVWTRVAGTTTNAAGASVTLTFPAGSAPMFYRTASP